MANQGEAIDFIKQTLIRLLDKQDYDSILNCLDKNIFYIGLSGHDCCQNIQDAVALFDKLKSNNFPRNKLFDSRFVSVETEPSLFTVYGEAGISCRETSNTSDIRISASCRARENGMVLTHLHLAYSSHSLSSLENSLQLKTYEMQTIYDNVDFGIMKFNMDGSDDIRYLNNIALTLLGYDYESFNGKLSVNDFVIEEEMPHLLANAERLKTSSEPISFKLRAKRQDEQMIWLACYGTKITEIDKTTTILYTIRDITEDEINREVLMSANRELRFSQQRYDIAISNMSDEFFDYFPETGYIIKRPNINRDYIITDSLSGETKAIIESGIIHPNSLDAFTSLFQRIDKGEKTSKETIILISEDGNEIVNEIKLTNIYDEKNKPIRAIGLITDITNKISLEREERYRQTTGTDRVLSFEANLTRDVLTNIEDRWVETIGDFEWVEYSKMIDCLAATAVHDSNAQIFRETFCRENLLEIFEKGEKQVTLEYRRKDINGKYNWIKNQTTIIKDSISGDIKIRCYSSNINEQKEKEIKVSEEQRLYEAMVSKDAEVYEVDLSNDVFLRGYDSLRQKFDIPIGLRYSQAVDLIISSNIFIDDIDSFSRCFARNRLISSFENGAYDIVCEYRRLDGADNYRWFSCSTHLFSDQQTDDIKAFSYEQDINEEKLAQLALIYKSEHDSLTELFNRGTTEQLIKEYLKTPEGRMASQAFILFDIDFFKKFNDNFGHSFGDAVLSQTAKKVRELFRDEDVVGRIGGDEFVVFMKNIPSREAVFEKAKNLCDAVRATYSRNETTYKVSVSIGIALSQDGSSYDDFYKHADTALYVAKEQGRDCFVVYQRGMAEKGTAINELTVNSIFENKSFYKNISDFVFRILYESPDKIDAINSVLELIGKQYKVSRAYIFEESEDKTYVTNTFEWCSGEVASQKQNLAKVSYTEIGDYKANFNDNGVFYLSDLSVVSDNVREILKPQAVKSMLQFAIMKNGIFSGFVGFDECSNTALPKIEDINELRNIASVLGVFVLEMRLSTLNEATKNVALSIVNGLNSYAYVIDKNSYELLFINDMTYVLAPAARVGQLCYKTFWDLDSPCEPCPMKLLSNEERNKCTLELYNPAYSVWTRATASWIDWTDGKKACLLDCVDITCYKK